MQTKKRAKPVKFGKSVAKSEETEKIKPQEHTHIVKEVTKEKVTIDEIPTPTPSPSLAAKKVQAPPPPPPPPPAPAPEEENEVEEVVMEEVEETEPETVEEEEKEEKNVVEEAEAIISSVSEEEEETKGKDEEEFDEPEEEPEAFERPSRRAPREDDSPFSNDGPPVETEKKKNLFVYFIVVASVTFLLGLAFIVGGYYALQTQSITIPEFTKMFSMMQASPTPEPTETPTPTATPKPVDLSAYTINVLNGSGVKGEAAKLKDALTAAGFKVGSVGNADLSDYDKTQVLTKSDVEDAFVDKLKETLEKSYVLDSSAPPSGASSQGDVTVIIGSDTP